MIDQISGNKTSDNLNEGNEWKDVAIKVMQEYFERKRTLQNTPKKSYQMSLRQLKAVQDGE
jgi:hypothetical protein